MSKFFFSPPLPSLIYVVDQCWSAQQIVLYFPRDSGGLRNDFDRRIRQLREGGFVEKWLADEMGRGGGGGEGHHHHGRRESSEKSRLAEQPRPLSPRDTKLIFLSLASVLAVCAVVFVLERTGKTMIDVMCQRISTPFGLRPILTHLSRQSIR